MERFLSASFTVALGNWNPGNRGSVVCCLRILPDSHPFPKWEGAPRTPAEPLGEKSHSSHSAWPSEVSGLLPKHASEDCSLSVRTVSLPDCVAMETKLFYALKSKYFLWPHALLTSQSKLGRTQSIKTIQTHSFLFFSLALETTVFLRLWEDKTLGAVTILIAIPLSHIHMSHSLPVTLRVTGPFQCS